MEISAEGTPPLPDYAERGALWRTPYSGRAHLCAELLAA